MIGRNSDNIFTYNRLKRKQAMEDLEKQVKEIRVNIDGLWNLTRTFHNPYVNKAAISLERSKNWLGKVLQYGTSAKSPYVSDGNRHSVKDIEPTADTNKYVSFPVINSTESSDYRPMNTIQQVDWLRQRVGELENEVALLNPKAESIEKGRDLAISRTEAWKYLVEARMDLGNALRIIKEENYGVANGNG